MQRKLQKEFESEQKEHSKHIELPEMAEDDEDALGLGFGFDP